MIHLLPLEIVDFHVTRYLPLLSILRLRRVCKRFRSLGADEVSFWKDHLHKLHFSLVHGLALSRGDFDLAKFVRPHIVEYGCSITGAVIQNDFKLFMEYYNCNIAEIQLNCGKMLFCMLLDLVDSRW